MPETPSFLLADELMDMFDTAYQAVQSHFERMGRAAKAYGNRINISNWPTISRIALPLTWVQVEQQLPFAMKYIFQSNGRIVLTPMQAGVNAGSVQKVERLLHHAMRREIQAELTMFPSVKDCFKYGVGYGLIDYAYVTPPATGEAVVVSGEARAQRRVMRLGKPVRTVTYRYLPPICVIPMPDGAEPDGPNSASAHFVILFLSEDEFRDMIRDRELSPQGATVDEIIEEARSRNWHSNMPAIDIIDTLTKKNVSKVNTTTGTTKVLIPVIRAYQRHRQTWLANGKHVLFDSQNTYQTFRSDLVKWSAWPDGSDWFPAAPTELAASINTGANIWYNAIVDLASYMLNPTRLINTQMVENPNQLRWGPKTEVKVRGPVDQAFGYARLPDFPPQLLEFGGSLLDFAATVNSQASMREQFSPGMVRGGSNALEMLLGSTTGRQLLAAMILRSGGYQPAVEKVLIKKQLLVGESGFNTIRDVRNAKTGQREFAEETVTLEDLRNAYYVDVQIPVHRMNSMAAFAERTGFFDRAQQTRELFDQRQLYYMLVEDVDLVDRVMLPEAVVQARQEERAKIEMMAAAQQAQPAGPLNATPGELAQAGAMPAALQGGEG